MPCSACSSNFARMALLTALCCQAGISNRPLPVFSLSEGGRTARIPLTSNVYFDCQERQTDGCSMPMRTLFILTGTLAVCTLACSKPEEGTSVSETPSAPFREAASERGIVAVTQSGFAGEYRFPVIMAGGVGVFDADGDGSLDVYVTDGGDLSRERNSGTDRLFLNDGQAMFRDHTTESGIHRKAYGMGMGAADVDGDGDVDVYLASLGLDQLYLNGGAASFEESDGLEPVNGWSTSTTFFDWNRDGALDLWVCRYVTYDSEKLCFGHDDGREFCDPTAMPSNSDVFLENDGTGRFRRRDEELGVSKLRAPGLGVVAIDDNEDGWLDIYVANDGVENHLWRNGNGSSWKELALIRGLAVNSFGKAEAGMGVVSEDLNLDGRPDILLTHLRNESNTMYQNYGGGRGFLDASISYGVATASLPRTGFGVRALDVDWNGHLDLIVANGSVQGAPGFESTDGAEFWDEYEEPDQLFLRSADGFSKPMQLGTELRVSRGLASGDLDGDGDLDFVVAAIDAPIRLFLNESEKVGAWIGFDVREGSRAALGALVTASSGDWSRVHRVSRDGSYLSTSDPRWFVAAPEGAQEIRVTVQWVDGTTEMFSVTDTERIHTLQRSL